MLVTVNVKRWIVLMHFVPNHFANPCDIVLPLPDTQTDTDVISFLRWALGKILNYGQACAFSCVTKAQASTIAHLIFISFSFLLGKGVTAVFTIILLFLETTEV